MFCISNMEICSTTRFASSALRIREKMHCDLSTPIRFEVKFRLKTYSASLFQGSVAGYSRSVRPSSRRFIISQDGQFYPLSLSLFLSFLLFFTLFSSLPLPSRFPISLSTLLPLYSLHSLFSVSCHSPSLTRKKMKSDLRYTQSV